MLAVFGAVFVIYNGSQHAEQSNARSDVIVEQVQTVVHVEYTVTMKAKLNHFVRKSAHVIEYALFGLFGALAAFFWKKAYGSRLHIAAVVAALLTLGITDEFIQSFTNRSDMVKDVIIDACGGLAGILFAALLSGIVVLIEKKRRTKSLSPSD